MTTKAQEREVKGGGDLNASSSFGVTAQHGIMIFLNGSMSRDMGPCPDIDCSCGCNTNSSGKPLNFKANSPSPPLSILSQAINTGRLTSANTSIWNNGLPPIVTDQEDIQT